MFRTLVTEKHKHRVAKWLAVGIFAVLLLAFTMGAVINAQAFPLAGNFKILYAGPVVQGSEDCSTWADVCILQTALANASSGDQIWVQAGIHYPGLERGSSFMLKNGVSIYGGFAGTENALSQRSWTENLTVLSGDIDQNDLTDPHGVITTTANILGSNVYHVVIGSGVNEMAVLDGFIITGGQAGGEWADPCDQRCGGGMYNVNGSPTLTNLRFSGNGTHAEVGWGGGMYNQNSSPTLTNVAFSGNSAGGGGGMYNENSSPLLVNVAFDKNSAAGGAGMQNVNSSPTLTYVTFQSNIAAGTGGGMSNAGSSPILTNVVFRGNRAGSGGGMDNFGGSNPMLVNVIFSGNLAYQGGGGGILNWGSSPILTNVTLSGNRASFSGGGMANIVGSNPVIRNSLFWRNQDSGPTHRPPASIFNDDSSPVISYSLVQNCGSSGAGWKAECGTDGGNNVANTNLFNPVLRDAPDPANAPTTAGDLRLGAGSPAINAGNNAFVAGILTDLDGNPRITGTAVDLGAYEAISRIYLTMLLKNTP